MNRWPFWAPTPNDAIEHVLDIANVQPGDRFLDLGCGDGRVLEAAARRGAHVIGLEGDADRAHRARRRLESYGPAARIIHGDFYSTELAAADVVFAFLSPATLHRLRDRLQRLPPGTKVATYGYRIFGWRPDRSGDNCYVYVLPPSQFVQKSSEGWTSTALVLSGPKSRTMLIGLSFGALPGRLELEVSSSFQSFAQVFLGASVCEHQEPIPVDLKVTFGDRDSMRVGGVRLQGKEFLVIAVGSDSEVEKRFVDAHDLERLRKALRAVHAGDRTAASLLSGE
ncbi:MAG: class I SAM-dependent methyltransferase [Acidimicrobiia bacterium]|nr:class I SAM-dependent methyltransferase [Acidimicrobiia bacterium]